MTYIIYGYFIISAICFGYAIGDQFNETHLALKIIRSLCWMPELIISIVGPIALHVWNLDLIQFGLIHMGYNFLKNNENKNEIIESLEKHMLPIWSKWKTGRYYLSAFNKLKKMNNI